jgi:hypothetical protein
MSNNSSSGGAWYTDPELWALAYGMYKDSKNPDGIKQVSTPEEKELFKRKMALQDYSPYRHYTGDFTNQILQQGFNGSIQAPKGVSGQFSDLGMGASMPKVNFQNLPAWWLARGTNGKFPTVGGADGFTPGGGSGGLGNGSTVNKHGGRIPEMSEDRRQAQIDAKRGVNNVDFFGDGTEMSASGTNPHRTQYYRDEGGLTGMAPADRPSTFNDPTKQRYNELNKQFEDAIRAGGMDPAEYYGIKDPAQKEGWLQRTWDFIKSHPGDMARTILAIAAGNPIGAVLPWMDDLGRWVRGRFSAGSADNMRGASGWSNGRNSVYDENGGARYNPNDPSMHGNFLR